MVDSADLGFYGAAWRFTDFRQHLSAGSVYLQFVLKSCEFWGARPSRVLVSVSHRNELPFLTFSNGANGMSDHPSPTSLRPAVAGLGRAKQSKKPFAPGAPGGV